jgi:alpha-D-xyloside xylohydrolase
MYFITMRFFKYLRLAFLIFLVSEMSFAQSNNINPTDSLERCPFGKIVSKNLTENILQINCLAPTQMDTLVISFSFPFVDALKISIQQKNKPHYFGKGYSFEFFEKKHFYELCTNSIKVIVQKNSWNVRVYRNNNEFVYSQLGSESGFMQSEKEIRKIRIAAATFPDEHYYGFGEKFNGLDQRGNKITMELEDAYMVSDARTYKSIPFFMSSRGYGLLVNSPERVIFHMADNDEKIFCFDNPANSLQYYIFTNNNPLEIISQCTEITGRCPLIPKWALEPWLSRRRMTGWSDVKTAEADIDMMIAEGYRLGVILWEGVRSIFKSDQASLMHALSDKWHDMGIKQVFWTRAGHIPESSIPIEGVAENFFIRYADSTYALGGFHGGKVYVDPTNAEAMTWWKDYYYKHALLDQDGRSAPDHWNLDGIKIDFCELFPKKDQNLLLKSRIQGMHNLHAVLFSEQIYNWMQELKPDGAITWVRGGGLGLQRVGFSWGGDRARTFSHMAGTVSASLGVSICGVPLIGHDLGGYRGDNSPEARKVYIRGVQYATFSPAFHDHGSAPAPWEQEKYGRENYQFYSRVRYNLIPYLYHYVKLAHETGVPIMRTLFLHFPEDHKTFTIEDEYFLGNELLIAPIITEENEREIYLPKGNWIDFWNNKPYSGQQVIVYNAPLNRIPVFAKQSAIVPLALNQNLQIGGLFSQSEKNNLLLTFRFFDGDTSFFNFMHQNGNVRVDMKREKSQISINMQNIMENFGLIVNDVIPRHITVNGKKINKVNRDNFSSSIEGWRYDEATEQTLVKIHSDRNSKNCLITLNSCTYLKSEFISGTDYITPASPKIIQAHGWDNSIVIDFKPVLNAESYVIKYWSDKDQLKNEIKDVVNTPYTISNLENGKKYFVAICSVNGKKISLESEPVSAIPQRRQAFFKLIENQIFVHGDHYLKKEILGDNSNKLTYGLQFPASGHCYVWLKARKNESHHRYFRWYQLSKIEVERGSNFFTLHVLKNKTEIERLFFTTEEGVRPILKNEMENTFDEKEIQIDQTKVLSF